MKTKNNVQKVVLRSAAIIVSFVLISFTVNAQDFWKTILKNSSFNTIALAMVNTRSDAELPTETESLEAMKFSEEIEKRMEVEDWMTDTTIFALAECE